MQLPEFGKIIAPGEKRMIMGDPSLQPHPLRYPWAWDKFLLAQANHWGPTDIGFSTDVYQYAHTLTDDERRMFDWVLSMLTTMDLKVLNNLEEAIERHITAPEASLYLARQVDEEALHTWTYQTIVESLNLDQNEVYQRYLKERTLYNKIEYAHSFHRRLMELRLDDHKSFAAIGEFMVCLFFWVCFEMLWFYDGFNFVYALARRGYMPGSVEALQYIQRDEAMHGAFWIDVIQTLIEEYPSAYSLSVQNQFTTIVKDVVHFEELFAENACRNILGMTAQDYMSHFKFTANMQLQKFGIQPIYSRVQPMPWVNDYMLNTESNFFERRVREYRKDGLDWEGVDNDEQFRSVMRYEK
jgi:ribonucleoside-diphosphate reductase beta chain